MTRKTAKNIRKHKMNKSNGEKRERCEPQTLHNNKHPFGEFVWTCAKRWITMDFLTFFCVAHARVRNLSCRMKFEYTHDKGVEFVHTFHSHTAVVNGKSWWICPNAKTLNFICLESMKLCKTVQTVIVWLEQKRNEQPVNRATCSRWQNIRREMDKVNDHLCLTIIMIVCECNRKPLPLHHSRQLMFGRANREWMCEHLFVFFFGHFFYQHISTPTIVSHTLTLGPFRRV